GGAGVPGAHLRARPNAPRGVSGVFALSKSVADAVNGGDDGARATGVDELSAKPSHVDIDRAGVDQLPVRAPEHEHPAFAGNDPRLVAVAEDRGGRARPHAVDPPVPSSRL